MPFKVIEVVKPEELEHILEKYEPYVRQWQVVPFREKLLLVLQLEEPE